VPEALARGNTLRRPACVHWAERDACRWFRDQRSAGYRVIGVELADEAIRLADLPAARQCTIAVPGTSRPAFPPRPLTYSIWL
jgi:tRNA (guanosine-2'-O-)-methyltransferase